MLLGKGTMINIFDAFSKMFKLGTDSNGSGKLHFFGISTIQNENMTIQTGADDKFILFKKQQFS